MIDENVKFTELQQLFKQKQKRSTRYTYPRIKHLPLKYWIGRQQQVVRLSVNKCGDVVRQLVSCVGPTAVEFSSSYTNAIAGEDKTTIAIRRGIPSPRRIYATEIYLISIERSDLPEGIYHLNLIDQTLTALRKGSVHDEVNHWGLQLQSGDLLVVLSSWMWRLDQYYEKFGFRLALLELGHVATQILTQVEQSMASTSFSHQAVSTTLGINRHQECPMVVLRISGQGNEQAGRASTENEIRLSGGYSSASGWYTKQGEHEWIHEYVAALGRENIDRWTSPVKLQVAKAAFTARSSGYERYGIIGNRSKLTDVAAQNFLERTANDIALLKQAGWISSDLITYQFILNLPKWESGLYRLNDQTRTWELVCTGIFSKQLQKAYILGGSVNIATFASVLFLVRPAQSKQEVVDCFLHDGIAGGGWGQLVCMRAAEQQWFGRPTGSFDEIMVGELLSLPDTYQIVYSVLVGSSAYSLLHIEL